MRIAYLVNQYPKVSHSFIRREIHALERLGFEISRISLRGWDSDLVDDDDHAERQRTRYVLKDGALPLLGAFLAALATRPLRLLQALALAFRMGRHAERPLPVHLVYLAEACRIERWLRDSDTQHLHAHFGTNSAEVAMFVHVLGGPRWSFTVHGPEEFDKPQFIGLAEKIRRCSFVVAVSSFARSQLFRNVEHEHWHKVHVVHCGLEPSFYQNTPSHSLPSRNLVCVGRLCEQKGQLLLVEAAKRVSQSGTEFSLTLAGDGELRSEIETLVRQYKLETKVRITGWISNDEVRSAILAARALVLPSFAEGLPVAIMEAMALRRPIISTFVAGIPELVRDGEHGWLIPAGDINALVKSMQECLDTPPEILDVMGEAGHEAILSRHDINTEVAKFSHLLRTSRGAPQPDNADA